MFANGEITNGDYFLYTDAWNPTVIQLRYMAELLGVDIRIGGMWHAGSYDPQDFLGRLVGDKPWVRHAEMSMYECYDHNFFATHFHVELFTETLSKDYHIDWDKIQIVGWPMEYLKDEITPFGGKDKFDIILFPHRVAPEKQVDIFKDLALHMPEYRFVVAQEFPLNKDEYHNLLATSRMVFSANLQETLGISWYEGALVDAVPFVPDRLSYREMATPEVLYPSEWTQDWDSYIANRDKLIERMREVLDYPNPQEVCNNVVTKLQDFFSGKQLYDTIKGT
tara:strand:- start:806 stop:1645 length:840 start_codon:yes stop_codon:yes gene_type:complete